MSGIKTLLDVPAYQLCCGCGLCAYLYPENISMWDSPVFGRRPRFILANLKKEAFQDGLEICPGVRLHHSNDKFSQRGGMRNLSDSWGPILEVWEAYATDPEIRFKGSSGGGITAISLFCLEQQGMQGVLHVAAEEEAPYLNNTVISNDKESLLRGAGSRYSPASPCEKLAEIEKADGLSVIVGKPCDIAAVEKVRKLRGNLNSKIGLTIACFCAGTPSTEATINMLRKMGVEAPKELVSLCYRGNGWPGKTKAVRKDKDGNNISSEMSYEESWGDNLEKYRQWRCYICPDHTGEFADLAVGDPWYKDVLQDAPGSSLILVRSEKGRRVLQGAIENGYIIGQKKEPSVLRASQINLEKARARVWGQLLALKMLNAPCPEFRGFSLFRCWWSQLTLVEKIRSVLGTAKRVYIKKLKKEQKIPTL